jgi:hypothetical protein
VNSLIGHLEGLCVHVYVSNTASTQAHTLGGLEYESLRLLRLLECDQDVYTKSINYTLG